MESLDLQTTIKKIEDYYSKNGLHMPTNMVYIIHGVRQQYNSIVSYCNSRELTVDSESLIDEIIKQKIVQHAF